jgi:hypothetical protein
MAVQVPPWGLMAPAAAAFVARVLAAAASPAPAPAFPFALGWGGFFSFQRMPLVTHGAIDRWPAAVAAKDFKTS